MKRLLLILTFFALSFISCFAQDWQKIVPLVSTCEDVEKYLDVKSCKYPNAEYKFSKYDVLIKFSEGKNQWKVPKGKVVGVVVLFHELPMLKTFKADLNGYTRKQVSDLPDSYIYENEAEGIQMTASYIEYQKSEFVQDIVISPPKKKAGRR